MYQRSNTLSLHCEFRNCLSISIAFVHFFLVVKLIFNLVLITIGLFRISIMTVNGVNKNV